MKDTFTFYVAGPWAHKAAVYETIQKVRAAGWQTNSRWAEPDNPDIDPADPRYEELRFEQAAKDMQDCIQADGLIYINSKLSEGKATELGMCLAMLKPIVIIGGRDNNIFLALNIPAFPTIEEALGWLDGDGQAYLAYSVDRQLAFAESVAMTGLLSSMELPNVN